MIKSELDEAFAQMRQAQTALQQLDLQLEAICFDPAIPSTVEAAIKQTLVVIDELLADFKDNSALEPMVDQLKVQYLEVIENKVLMSQGAGLQAREMPAIARAVAKVCRIFRGRR
ncbi:TPA: hypothetical protein ACIDYE_005540 [Pseudomonas aeruginosa]|jgi:hypothetical protein|uniref:hypothetical protein n=1 Tax=Pseudomonas TaxID=286 RepID=UPI0028AE542F|nr:hypothetical protein [Pseudomonas sp.]EIU1446445.1 hypothetical protein [Pseudomonas aeruginosa]ELY3119088.1 hypothetical protein [Pseudomonas aeruginosa]HEJ1785868.1 hypothetical protein [Pseudomonas aeruginosa]HEJ2581088.1 hypothetical protein [Pseudomonas aeruginosa]HEJ6257476.1 hypothetical protein [Pseudomonas aeruginosa]